MTGGDRAIAEDLCHDAILAFVTRGGLRKARSAEQALSYIKASIAHAQVDVWRKSKRLLPLEWAAELSEPPAGPEAAAAQEAYKQLLDRLGVDDQKLLALMLAGETLSRIAEILGVSYSNAGVRVHRIRKRINDLVEERDSVVKKGSSNRY